MEVKYNGGLSSVLSLLDSKFLLLFFGPDESGRFMPHSIVFEIFPGEIPVQEDVSECFKWMSYHVCNVINLLKT